MHGHVTLGCCDQDVAVLQRLCSVQFLVDGPCHVIYAVSDMLLPEAIPDYMLTVSAFAMPSLDHLVECVMG